MSAIKATTTAQHWSARTPTTATGTAASDTADGAAASDSASHRCNSQRGDAQELHKLVLALLFLLAASAGVAAAAGVAVPVSAAAAAATIAVPMYFTCCLTGTQAGAHALCPAGTAELQQAELLSLHHALDMRSSRLQRSRPPYVQ